MVSGRIQWDLNILNPRIIALLIRKAGDDHHTVPVHLAVKLRGVDGVKRCAVVERQMG